MNASQRSHRPRHDDAGGGRGWGPSRWYLALALGIVAGGVAVLLTASPTPAVVAAAPATMPASIAPAPTPQPAVPEPVATSRPAPAPSVAAAMPAAPAPQEVDSDPTPDLSAYVNPGEKPTMAEIIERLQMAGVQGGLAAFSPPGTRPPIVGLAVPEDFALPEGYVRHYQATDDGQRIEPILMFSPDYGHVDTAQGPVPIPQDRVVTPELAPPGLPLRRIVVPAPADAARPAR
jgi:hypothetical protein